MTVMNVEDFLNNVANALNKNEITPEVAVNKLHAENASVFSNLGMYIDNNLYRNGIFNTKQAEKVDPSVSNNKHNWFEVYRPWGTTSDLVRPVDKYAVNIAINQMLLALKLGDYKETEQMYDMEVFGNKYANLADC